MRNAMIGTFHYNIYVSLETEVPAAINTVFLLEYAISAWRASAGQKHVFTSITVPLTMPPSTLLQYDLPRNLPASNG